MLIRRWSQYANQDMVSHSMLIRSQDMVTRVVPVVPSNTGNHCINCNSLQCVSAEFWEALLSRNSSLPVINFTFTMSQI